VGRPAVGEADGLVTEGHVGNPSSTGYLLPTILDTPPMQV
jgi:hypothetical protein